MRLRPELNPESYTLNKDTLIWEPNIPKPTAIPERFNPDITRWNWDSIKAEWEIVCGNTIYVLNPTNLTEWIEATSIEYRNYLLVSGSRTY